MANDREMGGNYPPGLTQSELDRHLDAPHICHGCEEQFQEDDLFWDKELDQLFCATCKEDDLPEGVMTSIDLGIDYCSIREVELTYLYESHTVADQPLRHPEAAGQFFSGVLDRQPQEVFGVLALDVRLRPISFYIVAKGSMSASLVHPREVFRTAIYLGAHAIIIAHSHPSADETPSDEDATITVRLEKAGYQVGIHLVDHIIVGGGKYYSFAEHDRMPKSDDGDGTREDH